MSNVIPLFGSIEDTPLAAVESDWLEDFISHHLGDFMFSVNGLAESESEEEARGFIEDIKNSVSSWPS